MPVETSLAEYGIDPRPIVAGDSDRGVLLMHGLTGTPHDVRPIAMELVRRGFAVRAPLLAGHTSLEALERSTWRDWYASAEAALSALRDGGRRRVVVLGFSMGSLLALRLAALRSGEIEGAIAISVPLELEPWQRQAVHVLARLSGHTWLRRTIGVFPKRDGVDVRVRREAEGSPSLTGFPYPALAELVGLQREVAELLPHVRVPLLLLHGRFDHTAKPEHSERVAQRVGSARVERKILPGSFHLVGVDVDRERVRTEVAEFVISVLGAPSRTVRSTVRPDP